MEEEWEGKKGIGEVGVWRGGNEEGRREEEKQKER